MAKKAQKIQLEENISVTPKDIGVVANHIMSQVLSAKDKSTIIDMIIDDNPVEEILNTVNKDKKVIEDFILKMKDKLASKTEEVKQGVKEEVVAKVISMLKQSGLALESITRKINIVISKFEEKDLELLSVEDLYTLCLQQINTSDSMITKTAGGQSGIAIMTEVASQQSEKTSSKKKTPAPYIYPLK